MQRRRGSNRQVGVASAVAASVEDRQSVPVSANRKKWVPP